MAKAFGSFSKRGKHIFRNSAYLQWGESSQALGACLMLNPGAAVLKGGKLPLCEGDTLAGELELDDTMKQLVTLIEKLFSENPNLSGRFHIYNLFPLRLPDSKAAIAEFDEIVFFRGTYKFSVPEQEIRAQLRQCPWILFGYGCNLNARLRDAIQAWVKLIEEIKIPILGKKGTQKDPKKDPKKEIPYCHPLPRLQTERPLYIDDIYQQYMNMKKKSEITSQPTWFSVHDTRPIPAANQKKANDLTISGADLIDDTKKSGQDRYGWTFSGNVNCLVTQYSQLRVREGMKLIGYSFCDSMGGNGVVWGLPLDSEAPPVDQCQSTITDNFPPGVIAPSPKPTGAIDPMEAIEGDRTPLSYLQAAMVFHDFKEYGAYWHGVEWGQHVILPSEKVLKTKSSKTCNERLYEPEWDMLEEEPDAWEPCFYYAESGDPVVVVHTWSDLGEQTLNRFTHIFSKKNYAVKVARTTIAIGPMGIIF